MRSADMWQKIKCFFGFHFWLHNFNRKGHTKHCNFCPKIIIISEYKGD